MGDRAMTVQRVNPSPLAGEGAARRRRRAGEGAQSLAGVARGLRRQVPVGPYIADFLCFELRLIVEVDGGQHAESVRDVKRDNWLAQNEFRVLRFWNNDVLQNLEGVLTSLAGELDRTPHPTSRLRSTPPSPARGEGKKGEIAR